MKKALIALLVIFTLFTTTAYASSIDLESMTTDELIELKNKIHQEIMERMQDEDIEEPIYQGTYIVGEDIKPGKYVLVFRNSDFDKKDSDRFFGCGISCYQNSENYDNDNAIFHELLDYDEERGIVLDDGMILVIRSNYGLIKSMVNPSWAP